MQLQFRPGALRQNVGNDVHKSAHRQMLRLILLKTMRGKVYELVDLHAPSLVMRGIRESDS
jgi:hypothetical protein